VHETDEILREMLMSAYPFLESTDSRAEDQVRAEREVHGSRRYPTLTQHGCRLDRRPSTSSSGRRSCHRPRGA
jgi:hypothetical protein